MFKTFLKSFEKKQGVYKEKRKGVRLLKNNPFGACFGVQELYEEQDYLARKRKEQLYYLCLLDEKTILPGSIVLEQAEVRF